LQVSWRPAIDKAYESTLDHLSWLACTGALGGICSRLGTRHVLRDARRMGAGDSAAAGGARNAERT
jgi:hypothetical protein